MITILSRRHAASLFRRMREYRGMTQAELGRQLHADRKTIHDREVHRYSLSTETLLDTAAVFGFDLALIPARHPGARPTGTGWPA